MIKKPAAVLFGQTRIRPPKTLEFKLHKQIETFSFNPPINLFEKRTWFLALNIFEATNSVFNITDKKNSFSIQTLSYWTPEGGEELITKPNSLLELRSQRTLSYMLENLRKEVLE